MKAEPYTVVDGVKRDAEIHQFFMAGVEEDSEYRMTSYRAAVRIGVPKDIAMTKYLIPADFYLVD